MYSAHLDRDPYGSFQFESKLQDIEVTELPRRKRTTKIKQRRRKLSWHQDKCSHTKCFDLEIAWNESATIPFNTWRHQTEQTFKSLTYQQQLRFLSPFIVFRKPVNARTLGAKSAQFDRVRTSKAYDLHLPGPNGVGRFQVCHDYFKWFFCFGKDQFQNMRRIIFENRNAGTIWINHQQNYRGYKNSDEESKWIMDWASWAVATKSLVRAHYTANKDTVYFEAENGIKHTWPSLYMDWIKEKQTASYNNWVKEGGPKDPSVPKPKPCLRHFLRVIPAKFLCKPKRIAQDACNGCEKLSVLLREAEAESEQARYRELWNAHLERARFMYQLNTHWKELSVKSFEKIQVRRGTPAMEHSDTVVHYEFCIEHGLLQAQDHDEEFECGSAST